MPPSCSGRPTKKQPCQAGSEASGESNERDFEKDDDDDDDDDDHDHNHDHDEAESCDADNARPDRTTDTWPGMQAQPASRSQLLESLVWF